MLSQKQLQNVCLLYSGNHKQCRYLVDDPKDWKFYCVKHRKKDKARKDMEITAFIQDCKKKGIDPKSQQVALGDNCKGYPLLKHVEVGYDKP